MLTSKAQPYEIPKSVLFKEGCTKGTKEQEFLKPQVLFTLMYLPTITLFFKL